LGDLLADAHPRLFADHLPRMRARTRWVSHPAAAHSDLVRSQADTSLDVSGGHRFTEDAEVHVLADPHHAIVAEVAMAGRPRLT
jgi:hypothetical protein